jgi:protein O-GlcNAc transferase
MAVPDADQLWATAVEHHLAGRLAEAETLYLQLLSDNPTSAKTQHMLGMAEFQLGRASQGLERVESAIALDPNVARYHGHRGFILASMGQLDSAVDAYRTAIVIAPDTADLRNNLGTALLNRGDTAGALDSFREALRLDPSLTAAANNLGSLLTNSGKHSEAIKTLRAALHTSPTAGELRQTLSTALNNFAAVNETAGDPATAEVLLREALALQPAFAKAWFNLGKALSGLHRFDDAISAYRNAIAHDPEMADAYNNLGILLKAAGQIDAAVEQYRNALQRNPSQSSAQNNLGNALRSTGRFSEAETAYRKAIAIDPAVAAYWSNLGSVLDAQEKSIEGLEAFAQAVALRPDFSEAHNNIGNAKKNLGDLDGALAAYQRAIEVEPDNQGAHSNRLYTMYFHPGYSAQRIAEEHRAWNAQHAAALAPAAIACGTAAPAVIDGRSKPAAASRGTLPAATVPHRKRSRLRIGYVAPFFRDHCQSFFTMPLLSHHDRSQFEIFIYSDVAVPDAITAKLRCYTDTWRNTMSLNDASLAERIRADEIDILVDLCLHMSDNRLLAFARKPAPVQVTWLGYPGTTGLQSIDYRLTDSFLDPEDREDAGGYSERSYRLPDTFWCYDPLTTQPAVNELPLLRNGFVTFGCLNNFCKVNEPTLDLWAGVLLAVANSRLLLLAPPAARQRIAEALQSRGVSSDRIQFVGRMGRQQYLATYHQTDIGLDTIPYNGHTTTLDAFWMGVPVITLVGTAPAGRAGWSQLNNLQLTELAAVSPAEFTRIATELSAGTQRLQSFRLTLRDRLAASPLMDGARFAKGVETAYRAMWDAR